MVTAAASFVSLGSDPKSYELPALPPEAKTVDLSRSRPRRQARPSSKGLSGARKSGAHLRAGGGADANGRLSRMGARFRRTFLGLRKIHHPALAVNMIPVSNSYWLSAHLPNAVLLTYPARLAFQFHEPFYRARCRVPRLGVGVRALLRATPPP